MTEQVADGATSAAGLVTGTDIRNSGKVTASRQGPAKARRFSAGIIVFRRPSGTANDQIEVLLGHMGGPLWRRRDIGAWSIPKGGYENDETPLDAARREFVEETGLALPEGDLMELGTVVQANNKKVIAWAIEGDLDVTEAVSNTFELEWPPKSGQRQVFYEFDRIEWMPLEDALTRVIAAQSEFFRRLVTQLQSA